MILIVYTTAYRKGSKMFAKVAKTMQRDLRSSYDGEIQMIGIYGKKDLSDLFNKIDVENKKIDEFHFIGHSGMYGPMFGTTEYPEQYSPYELKTLKIPFSNNAKAFFHCCRSARWFAPFFARIFKIETYGYYWYTAFSENKDKYNRATLNSDKTYAAGCPGRKSHGIIGSIRKYSGRLKLEKMIAFSPDLLSVDSSYNKVAELYNQVFQDIKVRKDEWAWIRKHLPSSNEITVLDIGCGNGALLKELSPIIKNGLGLDTSYAIVEKAREMNSTRTNLNFLCINGPKLPTEDKSCDVVISLMSFRYLDWDPLMDEIKRVLKPGGKVLIIDMVTVPPKWHEYPNLLKFKLKHYIQRFANPLFYSNLARLVSEPAWKEMLKHNPIRAEHEMKWYLESRFPGKKTKKINIGMNSCILAFDSGNIENIKEINLSWP